MNKSVMKFIKTVKRGFGKRSPEILLGIGIASGITATVLAVKATPKALELLTERLLLMKLISWMLNELRTTPQSAMIFLPNVLVFLDE